MPIVPNLVTQVDAVNMTIAAVSAEADTAFQ
jgi:hypothetical protein